MPQKFYHLHVGLYPYHPVMAAHDFNGRQTVFMSFRLILSNTTTYQSILFPLWRYARTRISKRAAHARNDCASDLDDLSTYVGQSRARAHHALEPRIMKLINVDAYTLNTLVTPCIYTSLPFSRSDGTARINARCAITSWKRWRHVWILIAFPCRHERGVSIPCLNAQALRAHCNLVLLISVFIHVHVAPSSGRALVNLSLPFELILRRFEVVFWCLEWECCKIDGNSLKIHL